MADSTSESLHLAIESALNTGDFDRTRELSVLLGQAIIREAEAVEGAQRKALVEQGLNRLAEHLSLARVLRAHVASQLQTNTAVALYESEQRDEHCWTFNA